MKLTRRVATPLILLIAIFCLADGFLRAAVDTGEDEYKFHLTKRINAHGDEFVSLALTSDARRLVVGTEAGALIIWGIPERRILKQLHQGSPIHCVVALSDPETIVAAGGPHSAEGQRGVVRKWHIGTGAFEELQWAGEVTITTLATDAGSELVTAGNPMGRLVVWDSRNGKLVATRDFGQPLISLTLIGRTLYLTNISLEDMKKIDEDESFRPTNSIFSLSADKPEQQLRKLTPERAGRLWGELAASPDGRLIAARYAEPTGKRVALLEASTGKEIAIFEERSAAWSANGSLVLFDEVVPSTLATAKGNSQVLRSDLLKSGTFHASGTPSNITGHVVSPDGSMAWEIFQLGATLVECDLNKKTFNELHSIKGFPYAMDVLERSDNGGLVATGGDDGYVRVWKLSDLALVKEFRVSPGVPQGVGLMADARHVVFSSSTRESPTEISMGDVVSGNVKVLLKIPEPFVRVAPAADGFIYNHGHRLFLADPKTGKSIREFAVEPKLDRFSVSANGEWLAAANDQGVLYCFEVKTGRRLNVSKVKIENLSRLTVTNDGRHVYTTEFMSALKIWDTRHNVTKELTSIRGQAHAFLLSSDGQRIAVGGNHHDVAVYDTATGKRLTYFQTDASDFYVTNVWLLGDRLLFTTDAGVLKDGLLKR